MNKPPSAHLLRLTCPEKRPRFRGAIGDAVHFQPAREAAGDIDAADSYNARATEVADAVR
jgi:hypothetical protein